MNPAWWASRARFGEPGKPSPTYVRLVRIILRPYVRVAHRARLEGVENLPASGPFLLVANHSAGLALAEIFCFISLYLEHVGAHRPLAGFAHPFGFHVWPLSAALRAVGAIPSSYAAAKSALAAGVPILVFPGGDHESCRPVWQAHRVDFNGRVGFLRMAREANIPIVPMGIRGSHFTAPILWRSRLLPYLLITPRLAGLKRYGLSLLGLAGALLLLFGTTWWWPLRVLAASIWAASPLAMVPWIPWTIRFRIGAPIPTEALFGDDATDEALPGALARVQGEVQALVDD